MSLTYDAVGAIVVIAAVGIFLFYFWRLTRKSRGSRYERYATSRQPESPSVPPYDPYQEGYLQEKGRQAAWTEERERRARAAELKKMEKAAYPDFEYRAQKYEVRDPAADFLDDVAYANKKRKKNKSYW